MAGQGEVMSAPVSNGDNKNADDPSFYAPRGARRSAAAPVGAPDSLPIPRGLLTKDFTKVEAADSASERANTWTPLPAPLALPAPASFDRRDASSLRQPPAGPHGAKPNAQPADGDE